MTNRRLCVLALSCALVGNGAVAHAQATDACAPFTVVSGDERSVQHLDFGDDGPGPGDMRIGRRSLVDEAGNDRGHYRWVIIGLDASPEAGDLGESYGIHVMNLPDGQVHFQFLTEVVSAPDDTGRPSVGSSVGVVTGGTGAYASARGVVRRDFDGAQSTYAVDISCD